MNEISDRQIAAGLGVSDKTVGTQRVILERTAEIPQLEVSIGADGKKYPRKELESGGQIGQLDTSIGADGKERPRQMERSGQLCESHSSIGALGKEHPVHVIPPTLICPSMTFKGGSKTFHEDNPN